MRAGPGPFPSPITHHPSPVTHHLSPARWPFYHSPMATTTRPERPAAPPDLDAFAHHWQDEADAAYLYRILAAAEQDAAKSDLYRRLAEVEDRHVEIWGRLLAEHGRPPAPFR